MDVNSILSLPGFMFLALILGVGYFFLEAIVPDVPYFHSILDKYNGHLFDRMLHYVFWGIVINILFVFVPFFANGIVAVFNNCGIFGVALKSVLSDIDEQVVQLVFFSLGHAVTVIFVLYASKWTYCYAKYGDFFYLFGKRGEK